MGVSRTTKSLQLTYKTFLFFVFSFSKSTAPYCRKQANNKYPELHYLAHRSELNQLLLLLHPLSITEEHLTVSYIITRALSAA